MNSVKDINVVLIASNVIEGLRSRTKDKLFVLGKVSLS